MNEFTAKKLGEVQAFARIGLELAERGCDAFQSALGMEQAQKFVNDMGALESASTNHGTEITATKAEATTAKLRTMMEQYIGDEWDNPVELLEWMSFYAGSGSAHAALVASAATAGGHTDVATVASQAKGQFHDYLHLTVEALAQVGTEKGGS